MAEVWAVADLALRTSAVAELARRVEALGYDGLMLPDLVHDGLIAASLAVNATTHLRIATSALIAFPRSPMVVAVGAWDLQELSQGRFVLGLGPQIRANIVDRFSTQWTAPAPRMREYVQALRAIFDCWQQGTPLRFEGEHYRFTRMQSYTSPRPIPDSDIPIFLAGIGPNMTALAGELAQGLVTHPTHASPRYLREATLPALARGAARSGRDASQLALVVNPLCATGVDRAQASEQREAHRALLATLYSTPAYWPLLDLFGWRERGERLHSLVREGRWDDMTPWVNDEMLDVLVPTAPYSALPELLADWYAGIASAITFPIPQAPALDAEAAHGIARLREML